MTGILGKDGISTKRILNFDDTITHLDLTIKKHIPNFITSLNLFSGCLGIVAAFMGSLEQAAMFIGVAAVFDFMDGMVARLLHVRSEIGKQLDSLADVISFGLLPGAIVFQLMKGSHNLPGDISDPINPFPFLAFVIPVFSAFRLAKFNIDIRQADSFLGLPTPASAMVFGSMPLMLRQITDSSRFAWLQGWLGNYYFLTAITIIICGLIVSELPLFSLKFKSLNWKFNRPQYLLLVFSIISLITLGFVAIPLIILAYILLSMIF